MPVRLRLLTAGLVLFCLGFGPTAGAAPLLAHKTAYRLTLDGSRPTGQLEDMNGKIEYEISGDACAGYSTVTRQTSESVSGQGDPESQEISTTAWEDGAGTAFRFSSTHRAGDGGEQETAAALVRAGADALKVDVTKPQRETIMLKGDILLPTQHVLHILAAGAAGQRVVHARVYDGATDPRRVFDTLAVIGQPGTNPADAPEPARKALAGHTYYPLTVSYYEVDKHRDTPDYVMSFALYDNGVVGNLKIDYGNYALVGTMSRFEAFEAGEACAK